MKTPPFLLVATLAFWGWHSGFLIVAVGVGLALESSRLIKTRFEFSDDDYRRIWTLCAVLALAAIAYAFTSSGGPESVRRMVNNPGPASGNAAGNSIARSAASFIRWMPLIFVPFMFAQAFGKREEIPLSTISLFLRRRLKKARQAGHTIPLLPSFNFSNSYFALILLAAAIHPSENEWFFWGLCGFLAWALWPHRSRRFHFATWIAALAIAVSMGYFGQRGVRELQRAIESYNPQWLYQFGHRSIDPTQSRTRIGHLGRLKMSSRIVIRLEPKNGSRAPTYLREASYRVFSQSIWTASNLREDFETVPSQLDGLTWNLLPQKPATATNSISCFLDDRTRDGDPTGLLPLPSGSGRLENLPAYLLQKNSLGAVLATGPGVLIFDACSGPGETIDSPPTPYDYSDVPGPELQAVSRIASQLNLRKHSTDDAPDEALAIIGAFFQDQFQYSTWQDTPRGGDSDISPLSRFLLSTRRGHCEYFATATVLLLRQINIPARYAVGYAVHEQSGNGYVVRERDGHAWCQVWRNGTWEDFDTTPPSWVEEEDKDKSSFQFLADWWNRIKFEISKLRWGQMALRQYVLWALVPVVVILLYQIIIKKRWRKHRSPGDDELFKKIWPGLDSEFYQLERVLTKRGFARLPGETLAGWLQRVALDAAFRDLKPLAESLLRLHYQYRFDPHGLSETDRLTLKQDVSAFLARMQARV
jgi:hypothetical protein